MSNMSYCRFQNTYGDLDDCFDDLERRTQGEDIDRDSDPIEPLSDREAAAAVRLIQKAQDLVALVMEERQLSDLDDLTDNEIQKFVDGLQDEVSEAEARRRADDEEADQAEIDDDQPTEGVATFDPPEGMPRPELKLGKTMVEVPIAPGQQPIGPPHVASIDLPHDAGRAIIDRTEEVPSSAPYVMWFAGGCHPDGDAEKRFGSLSTALRYLSNLALTIENENR